MFIPEKCIVGFRKREDTYTGKLGYIIYWDEKNILRKKTSWEGWRSSQIKALEFENIPTEGFVLNKKVGGYNAGWNHRQTYARVYDPRGFEFEITIENLLYILDHCSSVKGKGIEGKFVYGWNGPDLYLLPINDPDCKEYLEHSNLLYNPEKISTKNLKIGNTYLEKNGNLQVYLGKHQKVNGTKEHVFCIEKNINCFSLEKGTSKIIKDLGDYNFMDIDKYNEIFNYIPDFNKIDKSKSDYLPIKKEWIKRLIEEEYVYSSDRKFLGDISIYKIYEIKFDGKNILDILLEKIGYGECYTRKHSCYGRFDVNENITDEVINSFMSEYTPKLALCERYENGIIYRKNYDKNYKRKSIDWKDFLKERNKEIGWG